MSKWAISTAIRIELRQPGGYVLVGWLNGVVVVVERNVPVTRMNTDMQRSRWFVGFVRLESLAGGMRGLGVHQLDYIAQDNPLAAISQDEQIEHQVDMLMQHPQMGRLGRKKGTRELVISRTPFVAVYRVKGDTIQIVRLLHSSQQFFLARCEATQNR